MQSIQVSNEHLLEVINSHVRDIGLVNHQIGSFNEFVDGGIKNILKNFFHINRDIVVRDSSIYSSINVDIKFIDVKFEKPYKVVKVTESKISTTKKVPIYPSMIRQNGSSYEADMFFDIKILITPTLATTGYQTQPREIILNNVMIAPMPIMTKSSLCNLSDKTPIELHEIYEDDPTDPGGVFIVKGHEWVISSTESVLYNYLHIRKQQKQGLIIKGVILSRQHESGFGNSYQTIFKLHATGSQAGLMTIEVNQTNYNLLEIPFYIFFRMFGVTTDRAIAQYILLDEDDHSPITETIWNVLNQAFEQCNEMFKPIEHERDQFKVLEFVGRQLIKKKAGEEDFTSITLQENVQRLKTFALDFFNKQYMTQFAKGETELEEIEQSEEDIIKGKLLYTGMVLRQMIMCQLGIINETDRDAYKTKRIITPGIQYAKEFKTVLSTYLVRPIISRMVETINQPQFDPATIDIKGLIDKSINRLEIQKIMRQTLSTGNEMVYSKKQVIKNRISSQEEHRKNAAFTLQSLRQITTNEGKVGSQNERAAELRHVHPSFIGFICPFQTPETGRRIGMNKQMAVTAMITNSTPSNELYKMMLVDQDIILLKDIHLPDLLHQKMGTIFVNGKWFGCSKINVFSLRDKYIKERRAGKLHMHTTVSVDIMNNQILFYTDSGRIIRPLIIVHRDKEVPYTKMTSSIINDLITRKIKFDDLIEQNVMEYISADEQENCLLALNMTTFYESLDIKTRRYTHVEIEQSILGIMALIDPYANHSQPQRASFETNQSKQTCGWPFLNYPSRFNKTAYMQHTCEKPLVKTIANDIMLPGGQNIIVAILISDGYNQEDSLIFNRASVDRCTMFLTHYTYKYVELEKNEMLGLPDDETKETKNNVSYTKLDERGLIKEGIVVKKGDIIVAKKQKINKGEEGIQLVDTSVVFDDNEQMLIEKVIYQDAGEHLFVKIKMKQPKPIAEGDKFSSREGCKGVVGEIKDTCDMPFTKDGIIPDMILSTLSVPTRMIVGELMEMAITRYNGMKGIITDGTAFTKIDMYEVAEKLKELGVPFSNETMYSGKTGEKMQYMIFNSIVFQQRLQKFAGDAIYVASGGPRNSTTRQPLEGKNQKGGLRLGEMENWCLEAHGATKMQREKLHTDSDGYLSYICETCGTQDIIVNQYREIYKCPVCKDQVNITAVPSCWSNNVFYKEVQAMGVGMKFNIKPLEFMV